MNRQLNSFLVMTRSGDASALALGQEVSAWLLGRGARATLCEHRSTRGAACQFPEGGFDAVLV
ncbi:MAG: hypothetical protein Q7I92_04040, partial [Humidesulfovibrio sp.]|nr:hypothetical protein [Humidesulfovibrio sp.]